MVVPRTAELQSLAPADCDVGIWQSSEYVLTYLLRFSESEDIVRPTLDAYRAAVACASDPSFPELVVTRAEYLESGSNAVRRKFPDWRAPPPPLKERDSLATKEKPSARDTGVGKEKARESVSAKGRESVSGKGKESTSASAKGKGRQRDESSASASASAGGGKTTRSRIRAVR
jgi:actin-related protein 6